MVLYGRKDGVQTLCHVCLCRDQTLEVEKFQFLLISVMVDIKYHIVTVLPCKIVKMCLKKKKVFPTFTFRLHVLSSNTHFIFTFKNTNHLIS